MGKKHRILRIRNAMHAFRTLHPEMCDKLVSLSSKRNPKSEINPNRIVKKHVKRVLKNF
jgi:hypothetical protein